MLLSSSSVEYFQGTCPTEVKSCAEVRDNAAIVATGCEELLSVAVTTGAFTVEKANS
jgi:hypothetical protein